MIDRMQIAPERQPCAFAHIIAVNRLVRNPAHFWQNILNVLNQRQLRRRSERFGNQREIGALRFAARALNLRRQLASEGVPVARSAGFADRLRTFGIIHRQKRSLRPHIGGAATFQRRLAIGGLRSAARSRMFGVALDFSRAPVAAFSQQTQRITHERHRRRIIRSDAGHVTFGLINVGNDFLVGLKRAPAQTGERQRCAHQFEKIAARQRRPIFGRLAGELAAQHLVEAGLLREFVERAPIGFAVGARKLGAHFVQVERLVFDARTLFVGDVNQLTHVKFVPPFSRGRYSSRSDNARGRFCIR